MGCAAVFPAAPSVGVARSPGVGVPFIPCVVSGGWWACAGVIRTASDSCFGGVCWGCAPPGVVRRLLGVGRRWSLRCGMPFLGVGPGASRGVLFLCASVSASPLPGRWVVSCPHVVSLPVPCPYGRLPLTWGPSVPPCLSVPFCPLPSPCPCPFPSRCRGGGVGAGGAPMAQALGVGGLEPLAEGLGGVGAEVLDRVAEEGLPCCLRHDGRWGGLGGVSGGAGADLLEGVHHVHCFSSSCSPGPVHPAAELLQSGGRPPGKVGGGLGGGRGPSSRSWSGGKRTSTCGGGGRGGAWGSGSGSGGGWRWSMGTGGGGNGDPGGARGGRVRWTWGSGGVLGGAGGSGSGGGGGSGWESRTGGGGGEKPGGGRRGRRRWTWGGSGARGGARGSGSGTSGAPGGRGGALGSESGASGWLRCSGGMGSVGAGGGCAVRGGSGDAAVCGTGPRR